MIKRSLRLFFFCRSTKSYQTSQKTTAPNPRKPPKKSIDALSNIQPPWQDTVSAKGEENPAQAQITKVSDGLAS